MDHRLKWLLLNSRIYKSTKGLLLKLRGTSQLILSPEMLFLSQHEAGIFNRYDVVVRLMAFEALCEGRQEGLALYHKMQESRNAYLDSIGQSIKSEDRFQNKQGTLDALVDSFDRQGFDFKKPIEVTTDLKLVDGSHRLACALHFKSEEVCTRKSVARQVDFGLKWFEKYFEPDEIALIRSRYQQLIRTIKIEQVLSEILQQEKQVFGRGEFYQSFEPLGIPGQRPTAERYGIYQLDKHLQTGYKVLDIGCNCGFFTLMIAQRAKSVLGVEINQTLVDIGQVLQVYLGQANVCFKQGSFNKIKFEEKFDFICSFAVHHWLGVSMQTYGRRLHNLLNTGGKVLLESQNIKQQDVDWEEKLLKFRQAGFREIDAGALKDDGIIERRFSVLQKQ
jgi:SAM-dependent methyltransferase